MRATPLYAVWPAAGRRSQRILIAEEKSVAEVARYLHLNPVRYGGCSLAQVVRQVGGLRYAAAAQAMKRFGAALEGRELAQVVDFRNYGVVATNAKRYERRSERDRTEQARMKQVLELLNCEM